ncbi:hypothetical protein T484DRAFT_1792845, partial [Baffinella frigidus]
TPEEAGRAGHDAGRGRAARCDDQAVTPEEAGGGRGRAARCGDQAVYPHSRGARRAALRAQGFETPEPKQRVREWPEPKQRVREWVQQNLSLLPEAAPFPEAALFPEAEPLPEAAPLPHAGLPHCPEGCRLPFTPARGEGGAVPSPRHAGTALLLQEEEDAGSQAQGQGEGQGEGQGGGDGEGGASAEGGEAPHVLGSTGRKGKRVIAAPAGAVPLSLAASDGTDGAGGRSPGDAKEGRDGALPTTMGP